MQSLRPRHLPALITGLLVLTLGGDVHTAGAASAAAPVPPPDTMAVAERGSHPLKLSHGRVDVEGAVITARVRMFWDDLEAAIRYMTADTRFRIEHTAEADALVEQYLRGVLVLDADGNQPEGHVLQSGEEDDMFWYVLEYRAPSPVSRLIVRNEILVDLYPEQRNVLQVRNTQKDVNRTFYFSSKKEEYSLSF